VESKFGIMIYMTIFITLVAILQSLSISLGVGSSTLAIINFFVAIADGKIDETERRMMGVVYIALRVAMVAILTTTLGLIALEYFYAGATTLTPFDIAQLFTLCTLFINATLMTLRIMPSTFGPALQAGSWYTLGALMALKLQGITDFTFMQFFMAYVTWLVLAVGIVNGVMSLMKRRKD
jgi:hypothetical protein